MGEPLDNSENPGLVHHKHPFSILVQTGQGTVRPRWCVLHENTYKGRGITKEKERAQKDQILRIIFIY